MYSSYKAALRITSVLSIKNTSFCPIFGLLYDEVRTASGFSYLRLQPQLVNLISVIISQ